MNAVAQTIFMDHVPAGEAEEWVNDGRAEAGDCLRACVASVIELPLESVPHFAQYRQPADSHLWWWALVGFCFAHGWDVTYETEAPEAIAIASGKSVRGHGHVVVVDNGLLVHDPHPSGDGLCEVDGYYAFARLPAVPPKEGSNDALSSL